MSDTQSKQSRPAPDAVCIGHEASYGPRRQIRVHGRYITILRIGSHNPVFHAIDTVCYHAGGPLTDGAVKQVAGRTCLQCPWHSYLVDIESGDGLYMDLDRRYRSKGPRQRVHTVEVRDSHLWVRLSGGAELASDEYAYGPKFGDAKQVPEFPSVDGEG